MSTVGLYVPRDSALHRMPAGLKLLILVLAASASVLVRSPSQATIALAVVLALFPVGRIPLRAMLAQAAPILWFGIPLLAFHLVVSGWERGVQVVATLVALVMLAALVSLTTRVTALADVVVRLAGPLRRVGVDPERLGLLVALGVRAVPVMIGLAREVREAQRARGAGASPAAYVVPLVVRALRHSDLLAEALVARGVDD